MKGFSNDKSVFDDDNGNSLVVDLGMIGGVSVRKNWFGDDEVYLLNTNGHMNPVLQSIQSPEAEKLAKRIHRGLRQYHGEAGLSHRDKKGCEEETR